MRSSSIVVGSVLFVLGACSSVDRADSSNDSPDGDPTADPGEGPEDGDASNDGASHEGGAKAVPCTSFEESITVVPTAGKCAGNVAQTCDPATSTMRGEDCGPDSTCTAIVLEERKYDRVGGTGWLASRSIPWAVCVPKSAAACALSWRNGWIPAETPFHTCAGDAAVKP